MDTVKSVDALFAQIKNLCQMTFVDADRVIEEPEAIVAITWTNNSVLRLTTHYWDGSTVQKVETEGPSMSGVFQRGLQKVVAGLKKTTEVQITPAEKTGAKVHFGVTENSFAVGVNKGIYGPELTIQGSSFGSTLASLKVHLTKAGLKALANMFAEVSKWGYTEHVPGCEPFQVRWHAEEDPVEWLHERAKLDKEVAKMNAAIDDVLSEGGTSNEP